MKFFKGKKEAKQEKLEKVSETMEEEYGLKDLDEIDLARIKSISLNKMGNTGIQLGSKSEIKLLSAQLEILEQQNWMIIRLLQEIKNNQ